MSDDTRPEPTISVCVDEWRRRVGWWDVSRMAALIEALIAERVAPAPCEGDCNPVRSKCGAAFCTAEEARAHDRVCRAEKGSLDHGESREEFERDRMGGR